MKDNSVVSNEEMAARSYRRAFEAQEMLRSILHEHYAKAKLSDFIDIFESEDLDLRESMLIASLQYYRGMADGTQYAIDSIRSEKARVAQEQRALRKMAGLESSESEVGVKEVARQEQTRDGASEQTK